METCCCKLGREYHEKGQQIGGKAVEAGKTATAIFLEQNHLATFLTLLLTKFTRLSRFLSLAKHALSFADINFSKLDANTDR
jgi:hypothetical protein